MSRVEEDNLTLKDAVQRMSDELGQTKRLNDKLESTLREARDSLGLAFSVNSKISNTFLTKNNLINVVFIS
jgi:hypothetical protein